MTPKCDTGQTKFNSLNAEQSGNTLESAGFEGIRSVHHPRNPQSTVIKRKRGHYAARAVPLKKSRITITAERNTLSRVFI
ncbi:MAG: hypothetical protein II149_04880 [Clostridia bacterium]|nr:hypothetical protein [Clostridia bacterium]